jgi:Tfp pilus assembly protein PilO
MPEEDANQQSLRDQLARLHDELETAKRQVPEDTDALGHVMTDISRVISGEELHPDDSESLREQLESHASDFEVRHPRTAGVMREVMAILSRLGI